MSRLFRRFLSYNAYRYPPQQSVHKAVIDSGQMRSLILDEINMQNRPIISINTLPKFTSMLKGFRLGELSIFSGPTGSGKTTILSQISLDYCLQGIPTLWGSFEIRKGVLAQVMLKQISNANDSSFEGSFSRFADMPLFFMDYFGATDLGTILSTMESAVAEQNVKHIIIDNLQFMTSYQGYSAIERFDGADKAIAAFRSFASTHSVHITIVIHPRKEDEFTSLNISSISGTSKATQEADNIILLQKLPTGRFLELRKNRFDGTTGSVKLGFDPSRRMVSSLLMLLGLRRNRKMIRDLFN